MGLLDKLTGRNSPAYKKALEAGKAQIEAKGDAVSARMAKDFGEKHDADEAAAKRIRDAQDVENAGKLREMGIDPNQLKQGGKQE